jgi:putative transposase
VYYYKQAVPDEEKRQRKEAVMALIDKWHTEQPTYGARKLRRKLMDSGYDVSRKTIRKYMEEIGIYAIYPKPNLSKCKFGHIILPYLLRNKLIFMPNQVWAIDITYIKLSRGHMYLTAIIDWYSRMILGWELSDTLETAPVLAAVCRAIESYGIPCIINSDQGSQFTSDDYKDFLKEHGIRQSMDGKARWVDNVIIERWFRSLKTENIYINEYISPKALSAGIREYIDDYNKVRPHQSLDYATPQQVYEKIMPIPTKGAVVA